jgi:hypothetical protein
MPDAGTVEMSDQLRADCAATLREYYREDRARIDRQAWMDLDWWAQRQQQEQKEKVAA